MVDRSILQAARATFDLCGYAEQRVGALQLVSSRRREYAGPCPICGGEDRFHVFPDQGRWFCRGGAEQACPSGTGPDVFGDPVDLVMHAEGLSWHDALARVTEALPAAAASGPAEPAAYTPAPAQLPSAIWRRAVNYAAKTAAQRLQKGLHYYQNKQKKQQRLRASAPYEAHAARYLVEERGLLAETILQAGLGVNRRWRTIFIDDDGREVKLPQGVTIPGRGPDGELWYLTARHDKRSQAYLGRKYSFVAGSAPGLFVADPASAAVAPLAIVVEGELDALLLAQHAPAGVAVLTLGSASNPPSCPTWADFLHSFNRVFVFQDQDAAGDRAAAAWLALGDFVHSMPPGPAAGEDVTDFWRRGGDLAAWAGSILE